MSKTFRYYDFTLTAGSSQVILVDAAYFRVQSATGPVDITVEGFGTLPGMLVGQGIKDTPFKRIVIRDASGAANVGTILVASQEFVDNRTYGVNTISGGTIDLTAATLAALNRPQAPTGIYADTSATVASTPTQIFSPASNVNGAIVLNAATNFFDGTGGTDRFDSFIAKNAAPAAVFDGEIILSAGISAFATPNYCYSGKLETPKFIAAGKGLYYFPLTARALGATFRTCGYKLL